MRVLAVSYMLPPALYPQAIQVGRLLTNLPVEMGVVCGQVGELSSGLDSYRDFARQFAFSVNVPFRPHLSGLPATLARRFVPFYGHVPDEYRSWVPLAEQATDAELKSRGFRPDVLVTFGVPMSDHLLGLRLKARLGVPWVAHFSDPWVDNAFHRRNVLANIVNRQLEREVVAAADRLIFTSREALDLVMGKYPTAWRLKATVLPHTYDPALYSAPVLDARGPVLRYLGNFYGHRTPVPLFRALQAILAAEPALLDGVHVELVGQMPRRMRLHPTLRGLPEGLVRLVDTVPYSQSLRLMSDADLLLLIDGPDDLSVFLPSKLVEYLGAGTPIFGIVPPGTSSKLLARVGAPVADPRKPDEVTAGLRTALKLMHERRTAVDRPSWGDVDVRAEFHPDRVRSEFLAILQSAIRG